MSAARTAVQPQPEARTGAQIHYYASRGYQWVADADIQGRRQHRPPDGPGLRAGTDQGQEGRGADARLPERQGLDRPRPGRVLTSYQSHTVARDGRA
jgi:hypothetical protein